MASTSKYKIEYSEKFGRYLVAAKNIKPGELIIREEPIAVGPNICDGEEYSICFACLRILLAISGKTQYTCSKCKIAPMCNMICEAQTKYHTNDECQILKDNQVLLTKNPNTLNIILLPLRIWFIKYKDPDLWEQINRMEAHLDERRNRFDWISTRLAIVDVIQQLRISADMEVPNEELIQKICGILHINAFGMQLLRTTELNCMKARNTLRGLYNKASLIAHNCISNTHVSIDDNFQIIIHASVAIPKNEAIFYNYHLGESWKGTYERRFELEKGKYFECDCSLCQDPYEMQSHLSSLICPHCKKGFIIMKDTSMRSYNEHRRWQCQMCSKFYSGRLVRLTLGICERFIEDCGETNAEALENLLKKLSQSLHTNHFLMIQIKQSLSRIYKKEIVQDPNCQKKTAQRMLVISKELYSVFDILEPGMSRSKGIILYGMFTCMLKLSYISYNESEISLTQYICQVEEARDISKRALTIMFLEPVNSLEGRLAKQILGELKTLNQYIIDIKCELSSMSKSKIHAKK